MNKKMSDRSKLKGFADNKSIICYQMMRFIYQRIEMLFEKDKM